MEKYSSREHGIEISFPDDWEVKEDFMGTAVIFLSPIHGVVFRDNVNIVVQDLSDNPFSLEEYTEMSMEQLKQIMTDFEIIMEPTEVVLNGRRANQLTFRATQGKFRLQYMQVWSIYNNTAYALTFATTEDVFWDKIKYFEEMLTTFRTISESQTRGSQVSTKKYKNQNHGLEIRYPEGWDVMEGVMGCTAIFVSPLDGPADQFQENINIIVQDLSNTPISMEEYTVSSLNQLRNVITNFNIINGPIESVLDGRRANRITFNGIQGIFHLQYIQIWTLTNNNAYMITCAAETDVFSDRLSIFEEVIKSFSLK